MAGKRVLLIVGGGVAAYKSLELLRRLRERGVFTRVVLTASAREFVTELSFSAISGAPVHTDLFDAAREGEMGHIQLSRQADLIVVAPATANLLARAAQGLADDLATTLLLATDKRVLFAPAMNLRMWLHPATRRNVARLSADGALFVGPEDGEMACGEYGPGRMSEPPQIVEAIRAALSAPAGDAGLLAGRHVVVTSGPTHEPIDPVRFIANRSSGKQGHAIAAAARLAGARVTLVSGPVTIPDPPGVETRHVETAREMLAAVEAALPADIFIGAAAVADWRVEAAPDKIKKQQGGRSAGADPCRKSGYSRARRGAGGGVARRWWWASPPKRAICCATRGKNSRARVAISSSPMTFPPGCSARTKTKCISSRRRASKAGRASARRPWPPGWCDFSARELAGDSGKSSP